MGTSFGEKRLPSLGIESEVPIINNNNDNNKKKKELGKYAIACTVIATVSSTLLGYDLGVMSGAILFITKDLHLNIVQEELIIGSMNIVSIFGGLVSGRLADAVGRRLTMALAAAVFFSGAIMMALAPSFAVLLGGRVLAGVAVGFGLMLAPVYSAELAPAHMRGSLVSLSEIFINFGVLLGYVSSFAFQGLPSWINWRLMLGLGSLPAIILAIGAYIMPESPRWLVTQHRFQEAKEVLIKTSNGDKEEAQLRLQEIMESIGLGDVDPNIEGIQLDNLHAKLKTHGEGVWREILCPLPAVKRMLFYALGVHFFQQASGIDALVYYSPVVFNQAGIRSRMGQLGATVGVGVCKFGFIFIATFLLDRVGRRPLMLVSSIGMTICLATVATLFLTLGLNSTKGSTLLGVNLEGAELHPVPPAIAAFFVLVIYAFVGFFSVGFGPIAWVFISEVFPLRLRAQATGLGVMVNRLLSGTMGLTFLSIAKAITPAGIFYLFSSIAAISVAFIYFFLPETKGKTLEEISRSLS